jgi:NTP pyrophosphatase (non-canonical NTP hydrolase)
MKGALIPMASDTIDWGIVEFIDNWLDTAVAETYKDQPLAQDWARVAKVTEECGEAVEAMVGMTGQNPRKGVTHTEDDLLGELADILLTGLYAIQHFTKSTERTKHIIQDKIEYQRERAQRSIIRDNYAA